MRRGEKVVFFYRPLATKHWNLSLATKHWSLSRAIKHWNLPLATELGPSFTSFLLLLFKRVNSDHLELSFGQFFWKGQFSIQILKNTCSHNLFQQEKNGYSWQIVEKSRVEWTFVVVLKEWREQGQCWELELFEKFHKPFRVWQHNLLLLQLQSLRFGKEVHLVVNFLKS